MATRPHPILAICLVLSGCGSVTDLGYTSPFSNWIGNSYPAAQELHLHKHQPGFATGELHYRLSNYVPQGVKPAATFPQGTLFRVQAVKIKSRLIDIPMVNVEIEAPLDGESVVADVELFSELPFPLVFEWPNQLDTVDR